MPAKLTDVQLDLRLQQLDAELNAQGLPLRFRPLHCFKSIHGSIPYGDVRCALFDLVFKWFFARYGERVSWDGVIGRIPVLLRDQVYLVRVPFVETDTVVRLTDRFESLPQEVAATFTAEEFDGLGRKIIGGTLSFFKLYSLSADDTFLDDVEHDLVWMAFFDLENAGNSLKMSGDTRGSIFHTHAAAEKFLKVALKRAGSNTSLQSLGHDLPKIFRALISLEPRYSWLKRSVDSLQTFAPNMQIRYQMLPRTVENAISAFNAGLSVCGTLAQIWMFDVERGTKQSSFKPDCFYLDGRQETFYCDRIIGAQGSDPLAILRLFRIDSLSGEGLIMDIKLGLDQSALYLEVKDDALVRSLRQRYEIQMRNRGRLVKPEELGIQITSGPEGSYTTGSRKFKVAGPPQSRKE